MDFYTAIKWIAAGVIVLYLLWLWLGDDPVIDESTDAPWGHDDFESPYCTNPKCQRPMVWVDCWKCDPESDEDCTICGHDGGWFVCGHCYPELVAKESEHEPA